MEEPQQYQGWPEERQRQREKQSPADCPRPAEGRRDRRRDQQGESKDLLSQKTSHNYLEWFWNPTTFSVQKITIDFWWWGGWPWSGSTERAAEEQKAGRICHSFRLMGICNHDQKVVHFLNAFVPTLQCKPSATWCTSSSHLHAGNHQHRQLCWWEAGHRKKTEREWRVRFSVHYYITLPNVWTYL